jgi:Uma2 family endonuclease
MATQEPTTEPVIRLGLSDNGRATTAAEFAVADFNEPWTYERVNGRLVVMSPEGTGHVCQSEPWRDRLGAYRLARPETPQAVVSQAWVRIDEETTRIADIGIYLGSKLEDLDIPDQIPDLILEFVSPSKKDRRRDYVDKRADHEKVGVQEYVIVDRFDRKVTVLTLGPNGYTEQILASAEVYRSRLLPGFEVHLAEVLPS